MSDDEFEFYCLLAIFLSAIFPLVLFLLCVIERLLSGVTRGTYMFLRFGYYEPYRWQPPEPIHLSCAETLRRRSLNEHFLRAGMTGARTIRNYDPSEVAAYRRAEELLKSQLLPKEYEQLLHDGYLRVESPGYPERTYLIPRIRGPVRVFENGKQIMRLCVGPPNEDAIPAADIVLMHKLMIEGNEEEYLMTANTF